MPAVYTRTGDKGETGLFGGTRVPKDSLRVEAYGAVDEANAAIGLAKSRMPEGRWRAALHHAQQRLFVVAAELASDAHGAATLAGLVDDEDIVALEQLIDDCLTVTGPQRAFVVPGRDERSGQLHVARTAVRNAERRTLALSRVEAVRPTLVKYLNRLSDTVYAIARVAEHWEDVERIERIVRAAVTRVLAQEQPDPTALPPDPLLDRAQRLVRAAQEHARHLGVPMAVAVVDEAGHLVAFERMRDTLLASSDLAIGKAWSAMAYKQTTAHLGTHTLPSLPGLEGTDRRVVLFGGGFPLVVDGRMVGGLGISGGTVEEDCAVARHALAATNTDTTGAME